MSPLMVRERPAHCLCRRNVICFSEFVLVSQNLARQFSPCRGRSSRPAVPLTHAVNDSWLHKGCHCRLRANLFPDTHAARAVSVQPSLAFNCTWYLSAGADHITSGSSSCLCWRPIPLYTPHFPSCPSDCAECQLLGASGFGINYNGWGGYSESGADSISACGRGKEGEAQVDRAVTGRRAQVDEPRQSASHLRIYWRFREKS